MKHSVHCEQTADVHSLLDQHFPLGRTLAQPRGSPAGLCPAMDWSTHTFVQRRLLAQKLLERSHASKALMDALEGPRANRDAALVILLHCCKLNNTLSQSCTKAGLIRRLFHLVNSPDMTPIAKVCDPTLLLLPSCDPARLGHVWLSNALGGVRCCGGRGALSTGCSLSCPKTVQSALSHVQARCLRIVAWLVEHARETLTMSERGRNFVQLTTAPQFLVDSLDANSDEPLVANAALSALASYGPWLPWSASYSIASLEFWFTAGTSEP